MSGCGRGCPPPRKRELDGLDGQERHRRGGEASSLSLSLSLSPSLSLRTSVNGVSEERADIFGGKSVSGKNVRIK